jgi:hypothetical protein
LGEQLPSLESRKDLFLKAMKKIVQTNSKEISDYNLKFLSAWAKTDNFLFWKNHFNKELLPFKSRKCQEQMKKKYIFPVENSDLYVGKLVQGNKQGPALVYDFLNKRQTACQYEKGHKNGPA